VDGEKREVPKGGLEPPCQLRHNALNVACLPISPLRLEVYRHHSIPVYWLTRTLYCISCDLSSGLTSIFHDISSLLVFILNQQT
jgi:hypothetical protein